MVPIAALLSAVMLLAAGVAPLWVGRFASSGTPPAPWRVVRLNKTTQPTDYRVASVRGVQAVEARSHSAMALLARPIVVNLAATPVMCWRWLVDAPVARGDMTKKAGDDYAARVYVAFDIPDTAMSSGTRFKLGVARRLFGAAVPDAALNYVWDNGHPVGFRRKSPYTDRAELIVAETGAGKAGTWVVERVNIAADFARAFGSAAGKPIQLAVASDTDNTKSSARAAFADIHFVGLNERCLI